MSPRYVIASAFLVGIQVFLAVAFPSPVVIACAVFTALMFAVTFASWWGVR